MGWNARGWASAAVGCVALAFGAWGMAHAQDGSRMERLEKFRQLKELRELKEARGTREVSSAPGQADRARPAAPRGGEAKPTGKVIEGAEEFEVRHGGMERRYLVKLPPGYRQGSPAPLILAFHGGGGSAGFMANESHYGIGSKAGQMGAIAIFPNGISPLPSGMMGTWNAGNCCASARDKNIDDVGFVRKIIEDAKARWTIDSNRVYATGMSNGGMISYRLACQLPEHIKAIAAVGGTDGMGECSPGKPVPVLHIHALDDDHVLYNGGMGPAGRDPGKEADFRSVPSTIEKWKAIDGCSGAPTRVLEAAGARCDRWMCSAGAQVQLCSTDAGGHSWPGGGKTRSGKGAPSQAMSANDAMWDFFGQLGYASARK